MLLEYFGIFRTQRTLIKQAKTTKSNGTSRKNLVLAYKKFGLKTKVIFPSDLNDIKTFLKKKIPVIVSYLELDGDQEHYSIVIGMTKKELIFQDPWLGSKYRIDQNNFLLRWHNQDRLKKYRGWMLAVYQPKKPGFLKRLPGIIRNLKTRTKV